MRSDQFPQKILIVRTGSIGDTVFNLPIFHFIKDHWPLSKRMVLTNWPINEKATPMQSILGNNIWVHDYLSYIGGTRNIMQIWRLLKKVRQWHPDIVIYINECRSLPATYRDACFFRFSGAQQVIGVPRQAHLRTHLYDKSTGLYEGEVSRIARTLSPLGKINPTDPAQRDLLLNDTEHAKAQELLKDWAGKECYIGFAPGVKQAGKDWTAPNWQQIMHQLTINKPHLGLLLIGGKSDRTHSAQIAQCWDGPVLNMCGNVSPRISAALLQQAQLFLGPDSGPMHLAAAVRTPVVAVFSTQYPPGIWFPLGERHRIFYPNLSWSGGTPVIYRLIPAKETFHTLPPDQIAQACLALLSE